MKKETITLDAIKKDLAKAVRVQMSNKSDWRFSYIIPASLLAVTVGVLLKSVWVGLLVSSIAVYHIVLYVLEYKEHKAKHAAVLSLIERGEISISREVLSHVSHETIYEPHGVETRFWKNHATKTVTVYYFNGGVSWRVPRVSTHYAWSRDFHVSGKGLENISIVGDEFFLVSLQKHYDVSYIYPCKNFELGGELQK